MTREDEKCLIRRSRGYALKGGYRQRRKHLSGKRIRRCLIVMKVDPEVFDKSK